MERRMNLVAVANQAAVRVHEDPQSFLEWLEDKDSIHMVSFLEKWAVGIEKEAVGTAAVMRQVADAAEEWSTEDLNLLYDRLEREGVDPAHILGGFVGYLHYHKDSPLYQWIRWQSAWEVMDACLEGQSFDWVAGYIAGKGCIGAPGMEIVSRLIKNWFDYFGLEGTPEYFIC